MSNATDGFSDRTEHRSDQGGSPRLGLPSEHAQRQVGKVITWQQFEPRQHKVEGVCTKAERIPGMTVQTDDGTFLAVRFRIKPKDGGRAVWTNAFADTGEDVDG